MQDETAGKGSEDATLAPPKVMFIILVFILEVMEYHCCDSCGGSDDHELHV